MPHWLQPKKSAAAIHDVASVIRCIADDELNSCSKIKSNDATINSSMWDETNVVGSKVVPSNHDKMTSLTEPKVVADSGFEDEQISPHVTFATNDDSIRVNAMTDNTPPRVSPSPAMSTPGLNSVNGTR